MTIRDISFMCWVTLHVSAGYHVSCASNGRGPDKPTLVSGNSLQLFQQGAGDQVFEPFLQDCALVETKIRSSARALIRDVGNSSSNLFTPPNAHCSYHLSYQILAFSKLRTRQSSVFRECTNE